MTLPLGDRWLSPSLPLALFLSFPPSLPRPVPISCQEKARNSLLPLQLNENVHTCNANSPHPLLQIQSAHSQSGTLTDWIVLASIVSLLVDMPQTSEGSREDGSSSGWVTQNYLEQEKLMALLADSGHFWEVLELVDVPSLTAVQNTGAVHDEEDLRRSRDMCLRGGCGGFVVKGGDFDAEGNEIDPPRGFLFRKTQAELRELARPVSEPAHPKAARPTLWLPPDDFVADSGFRAGLFPAPSMHIRWEAPRPVANVSAFACRVCVEQPTDCTYYMTCGFHCGYSGIQEHPNGKKQLLFSVWDAHGYKCEPLQCADGLDAAGCFAGEGCGAGNWVTNDKAAYANWSPGTSYTFCVRAAVERGGAATIFACHVFTPEDQTWHSLGVIRRPQPAEEGLGKPPLKLVRNVCMSCFVVQEPA